MIAGTSRKDQWENNIRNEHIRDMFEVNSVEEAASFFCYVQKLQENILPKRISSSEVVGKTGRCRPRRIFTDSVKNFLELRGIILDDQIVSVAQSRKV